MKLEHVPQGNPCNSCGHHAARHRVYHKPLGNPCRQCGLPHANHRFKRNDDYLKRKQHKKRRNVYTNVRYKTEADKRAQKKYRQKFTYLGIDGEGQGKLDHKYIFLACATEDRRSLWSVENKEGLSTKECLDFLLRLPQKQHKIFAFAFQYDLTKILTDLGNRSLYYLFRPELRQRKKNQFLGPLFVLWQGYKLNYQAAKFSVQKGNIKIVIWDIFKFYQSKFVGAIQNWKVGNEELWTRMQQMKDQREHFDRLNFGQVKDYCFEECACMAELARKLTEAHEKAGLKLQSYYGAGSSASAMLNVMGIKEQINRDYPEEMKHAVASAFFGGRFENSVIGPIQKEIHSYDISSAYPYQLFFLPCLLHGKWELTSNEQDLELSDVCHAVVCYELISSIDKLEKRGWGPFPFREENGSICFPKRSGGGWVYRDEYLWGKRLFPSVRFREAWILRRSCNCQPFQRIAEYYRERCKIGKEGPGIVIKLGCNSCYGKLAQSVGNAVYNSWIWAGMITSGTRAQLLEMLSRHNDWRNVLMMATDGICSLEKIDPLPLPKDTGTWDVKDGDILKPLGGWEHKVIPQGMFFARPGIYFPLNPTDKQIKDIRGRGVGKSVVLENWQNIMNAWPVKNIEDTIKVSNVSRFCGAKTSISVAGKIIIRKDKIEDLRVYHRADGNIRKGEPAYGQWIKRSVDMSFNPMPKRKRVNKDNVTLELRSFPMKKESTPYDRCLKSEEANELKACMEELLEQPDADLVEYE